MGDVKQIMARQQRMEANRSNFERLWTSIAELMLPRQADFLSSFSFGDRASQGMSRTVKIHDETATQALQHGVSVFESEVIPRGGMWQQLVVDDEKLMGNLQVRQWFEKLTRQLFALRNSPKSGFANQTHESIASLLAFGTQGMWVDHLRDARGTAIGLAYRSEHLGEIYVEENHLGHVDTVHRKFRLTHRQAIQKWGAKAPEAARKGERDNRLDDSATYLHVIQPNRDYQPGRIDRKGKPIASCYIETGGQQSFDEGGYRTMPMTVSRYEKSPTEDYGRAPGMDCLPATRACQRIMADLVTAVEFAARPAMAAHDDLLTQMIRYRPGGISYGAIDDRGNPLIKQLFENADIAAGFQMLQAQREVIERAFFVDLFIARKEIKSHVSATEMMQREQEKGVLLAPLARQETEWFTPQAEREIDLMADMGLLDDMPPELEEAGGRYLIRYDNPLTRARASGEAAGFYQLQAQLAPLMALDPSIAQEFGQRFPMEKVLPNLAYIHGVPASWEASDDERQAAKEQSDQRVEAADALAAGQGAADIAKTLSQVGAIPNAA